MVVFLTADLMMASNAGSHARQAGIKVIQVSSQTQAIDAIRENNPHLLLVDLQCSSLDIEALGQSLGKLSDAQCPITIAYAQHVETEKLQAATAAGFDQVLTRGQMNGQMRQIIAAAG